jgi:hypothetical protein
MVAAAVSSAAASRSRPRATAGQPGWGWRVLDPQLRVVHDVPVPQPTDEDRPRVPQRRCREYETEMLDYGFAEVERSLRALG